MLQNVSVSDCVNVFVTQFYRGRDDLANIIKVVFNKLLLKMELKQV